MSKPEEKEWFVTYKIESFGKIKLTGSTRADISAEVLKMDLLELAKKGDVQKIKIIGIAPRSSTRIWK